MHKKKTIFTGSSFLYFFYPFCLSKISGYRLVFCILLPSMLFCSFCSIFITIFSTNSHVHVLQYYILFLLVIHYFCYSYYSLLIYFIITTSYHFITKKLLTTIHQLIFLLYPIICSLFHMQSPHQDHGPCYLQLPVFFLYIHSPLLLENKKLL